MEWFKHYNSASEGGSFEILLAEKDFETAFIYWWLLEQVSKFEDSSSDENRGRIVLNFSYFKRKLFLNFQRTSRVLQKIAKTFDLEIKINLDETIEVYVPNWLKLQENRGGKKSAKFRQSLSKTATEVRSKNKEVELEKTSATTEFKNLNQNSAVSNFNARFSPDVQKWEEALDEFGLKKRLRNHLGAIINTFNSPQDLKTFIDLKATCDACKKIVLDCGKDEQTARVKVENFVLVCIKREIGVLSENPKAV